MKHGSESAAGLVFYSIGSVGGSFSWTLLFLVLYLMSKKSSRTHYFNFLITVTFAVRCSLYLFFVEILGAFTMGGD